MKPSTLLAGSMPALLAPFATFAPLALFSPFAADGGASTR